MTVFGALLLFCSFLLCANQVFSSDIPIVEEKKIWGLDDKYFVIFKDPPSNIKASSKVYSSMRVPVDFYKDTGLHGGLVLEGFNFENNSFLSLQITNSLNVLNLPRGVTSLENKSFVPLDGKSFNQYVGSTPRGYYSGFLYSGTKFQIVKGVNSEHLELKKISRSDKVFPVLDFKLPSGDTFKGRIFGYEVFVLPGNNLVIFASDGRKYIKMGRFKKMNHALVLENWFKGYKAIAISDIGETVCTTLILFSSNELLRMRLPCNWE